LTFKKKELDVFAHEQVVLHCNQAEITRWYLLTTSNKLKLVSQNKSLIIKKVSLQNSGSFFCYDVILMEYQVLYKLTVYSKLYNWQNIKPTAIIRIKYILYLALGEIE